MVVEALASCIARASATMISTMLNWIDSFPTRWGLIDTPTGELCGASFEYLWRNWPCDKAMALYIEGLSYGWLVSLCTPPGPHLNITGLEIHVLMIKQLWDCGIFVMGTPIIVRWHFNIEMTPVACLKSRPRDPCSNDKTAVRLSYLWNGNPYTCKMAF